MHPLWQWRRLLFLHAFAIFLVASFLLPYSSDVWSAIDCAVFKALNGSLKNHPHWQTFWAVANHSLVDWVGDLVMLGFFLAYLFHAPGEQRARRIAEMVVSLLFIAAVIYFINRLLFRETLRIPRASPTLVFDSGIRLSENIDWLRIKDSSSKSFPGDHATTAILFATCYTFFAGWRLGIWAILWAILVSLPRVVLGAHWFSDVVMGSGSIVLVCCAWLFCTPLCSRFLHHLERLFLRTRERRKRKT